SVLAEIDVELAVGEPIPIGVGPMPSDGALPRPPCAMHDHDRGGTGGPAFPLSRRQPVEGRDLGLPVDEGPAPHRYLPRDLDADPAEVRVEVEVTEEVAPLDDGALHGPAHHISRALPAPVGSVTHHATDDG